MKEVKVINIRNHKSDNKMAVFSGCHCVTRKEKGKRNKITKVVPLRSLKLQFYSRYDVFSACQNAKKPSKRKIKEF